MAGRPARAKVRLTAPGVALVGLIVTLLAALLDLAVSPGLGVFFGLVFVPLCGWLALRARRTALFTAAVLPPLAYLAAAVLATLLGRSAAPPDQAALVTTSYTLAGSATILFMGTAAGAGIAMLRRAFATPDRVDSALSEDRPAPPSGRGAARAGARR